jgi:hypothetical protein
MVYPKVSGLAAWSENCKWYSFLPLCSVVSLFCEFFCHHNLFCCFSTCVYCCYFVIDSVRKLLDTPSYNRKNGSTVVEPIASAVTSVPCVQGLSGIASRRQLVSHKVTRMRRQRSTVMDSHLSLRKWRTRWDQMVSCLQQPSCLMWILQ